MADKGIPENGGIAQASDKDAAACLAQGNPKASSVPVAWGQKDQSIAGQKLTGR